MQLVGCIRIKTEIDISGLNRILVLDWPRAYFEGKVGNLGPYDMQIIYTIIQEIDKIDPRIWT